MEWGYNVTINTSAGSDSVVNLGDSVTIDGGGGNDEILNSSERQGNTIHYYPDYVGYNRYGRNVVFKYNSGDDNDIFYGFKSDSTLSICGGAYLTTENGDDVIVTVGDGEITLVCAAKLSKINIVGMETNSIVINNTKSNTDKSNHFTLVRTTT